MGRADCPVGILGFQRRFHDLTIHSCHLPPYLDDAILPVDVTPLETQQLTPAQTSRQLDVVHLIDTGGFRFLEECLKLLCRDGLHLLVFQLGEGHRLAWILQDDLLRHGEVHGAGNHLVDVPHRLGGQSFRLTLGFGPLYPPLVYQLAVQLLKIHGAELLQRDLTDVRCYMVINVTPVGLVAGWSDLDFADIFEPLVHPLFHRVLSGSGKVHLFGFFQSLSLFLFDLGLRFAKDILEDLLAGFRVSSGCEPTFPTPLFPLADIALVSSTFPTCEVPRFARLLVCLLP